ncbi:hypothetical protein [Vulcanisaeta sp. JCM 14467]|uniref:hypothetical protein n=1 Tax=Vulcanisaeta sp. JCM 14467 TaxID=1295370 RepID=UPI000A6D2B26|nr:hypothetical protein [Vulcanisaeta sp. JCM 14467]
MGLTFAEYYVLAVLTLAIVLLLMHIVRYDVVGLLVMALLIIGGIISPGRPWHLLVQPRSWCSAA